jgi:hypothetical protein
MKSTVFFAIALWLLSFPLAFAKGASSSHSSGSHSSPVHHSPPVHHTPAVHHTPPVHHAPAVHHAPIIHHTPKVHVNNKPIRTEFRSKTGKLWGTATTTGNRTAFRSSSGKLLSTATTRSDGKTEARTPSGKLLFKF